MRSPSHRVAFARIRLHCESLEAREVPAGLDLIAVAPDSGPPIVRVLDATTQTERFSITTFDANFRGGVRVAVGDVTGDGVQDIIAAAGIGNRPLVRIFSGTDGSFVREIVAYDEKFRGGVFIAVGDTNNDGNADIITGRGIGLSSGKQVKVFSGLDGSLLQSYDATNAKFRGGVHVAAGDVNGDNRADVVTGLGTGGTSEVRVFSGATGVQIHNINAFGKFYLGGVSVAVGDVDGDGRAEIIAATNLFGNCIRVFDGADGHRRGQFAPEAPGYRGGMRVTTTHGDADGLADIVVSSSRGKTVIRDGVTFAVRDSFDATKDNRRAFVGGAAIKDGDAVIDANTVALRAIRTAGMPPPRASRLLAMVHAAAYDAVNGILGGHDAYMVGLPAAPVGASADAAAAAAAHRVLSAQLPAQVALFDKYLAAQLATLPDNAARDDGEGYGVTVANALLTARSSDGAGTVTPFTPDPGIGHWQPTPAALAPALLPNWPTVTPFAMTSGDQFRPADGPPDVTSADYTAEYNEVKSLGSATSSTRTADQTQIALFWADGGNTVTPPGHWNQIARDLALENGLSLAETARLFAHLNIAMADAAIASWDAKYAADGGHGRWRPITGIRQGDADGNADTVGDAAWIPLIATPPFPAYTSGHSTFSSAAAVVLGHHFGIATSFLTYTDALNDVARQQASFAAAAQEAALSRLYGGIHWRSDNDDGLTAGTALSQYVVDNFLS